MHKGKTANAVTERGFVKLDKHPACILGRIFLHCSVQLIYYNQSCWRVPELASSFLCNFLILAQMGLGFKSHNKVEGLLFDLGLGSHNQSWLV